MCLPSILFVTFVVLDLHMKEHEYDIPTAAS